KSFYYVRTLGAVLYRAGRTEEAITKLDEAGVLHGAGGNATSWLFLALAHQKLGHIEEAQLWLEKASDWLDKASRGDLKDRTVGTPLNWADQIALELLRREAEALILGKQDKNNAKKKEGLKKSAPEKSSKPRP